MKPLKIHKDLLAIIKMYKKPVRFSFLQIETTYTIDVIINTLNELIKMKLIEEVAGKKYRVI